MNSPSLLFWYPKHDAKHKGEYTYESKKNEETYPTAFSIWKRLGGIINTHSDATKEIKIFTMYYCDFGTFQATRKFRAENIINIMKCALTPFQYLHELPLQWFPQSWSPRLAVLQMYPSVEMLNSSVGLMKIIRTYVDEQLSQFS